MEYLLLITGLVLIYFSTRLAKPSNNGNNFSNVLQSNINKNELDKLIDELKQITYRIENIEDSLLLINEKLDYTNLDSTDKNTGTKNTIEKNTDTENQVKTPENYEMESEKVLSSVCEKNTINNIIYKLQDEGKTVDEISSITRIGKGEILLRIGLRKQKQ